MTGQKQRERQQKIRTGKINKQKNGPMFKTVTRKQIQVGYAVSLMRCAMLVGCVFLLHTSKAQEQSTENKKKKIALLKDTLDGKLDFSYALIDAKGFMPVPFIVTEPALGGFGGMLVPVFITPVKAPPGSGYTPPDITGGAAMYTANNSWALMAFRAGSIPKLSMKYRVGIGYANVNIGLYPNLPLIGEKKIDFNVGAFPVLLSLSKKISKQDIYLGVQYVRIRSVLEPRFNEPVPPAISGKQLDNTTAALGLFLDWDKRNTIFTPDKGFRTHVLYSANANWTGSDFTYQRLDALFNWFLPVKKTWISGLRAEVQQVFNDPPFYLLPSVNLRGVPAARFQGNTTALIETEQRIDFNLRWSVVGFGGLAKAIAKNESFSDAQTIYNIGTGFRYLIARAFKIRAGIDIAKGTDSWGYYIVFGHNWNR